MNQTEIERKWIVNQEILMESRDKGEIKFESTFEFFQGYIQTTDKNLVIRYRLNETLKRAYHTMKYHLSEGKTTEIEVEIPYPDGKAFINHSDRILHKKRRIIYFAGQRFEVDFFDSGLIIAELELRSLNDSIALPAWCESEVTGDRRYSNYSLSSKNSIKK